MLKIIIYVLAFALIVTGVIFLFSSITTDAADEYTYYCNVEGLLCREFEGREGTSYVLDAKGNPTPCVWSDDVE